MERKTELIKYDLPEIEGMMTIQQEIIQQQALKKNELFMKIAMQVLGREATIDDGPDFTLFHMKGKDYELISYKGIVLGSIRFRIAYQDDDFQRNVISAGWIFNPDEKDFNNP